MSDAGDVMAIFEEIAALVTRLPRGLAPPNLSLGVSDAARDELLLLGGVSSVHVFSRKGEVCAIDSATLTIAGIEVRAQGDIRPATLADVTREEGP